MREVVDLPKWHQGTVDYYLQQGCVFYFREINSIIKYLLRQRTFLKHLVYEPIREFDREGNQVYTDMLQEYGILPHSRTYYCLLFSLYHMFIIFVISY